MGIVIIIMSYVGEWSVFIILKVYYITKVLTSD